MKIPTGTEDRAAFVRDVMTVCQSSQAERQEAYRTAKQIYLYGDERAPTQSELGMGVINKVWNQIDKTTSMLYSSDTARFGVEIARHVDRSELKKCPALTDAVMDAWQTSESDIIFGQALEWALVYNTMIIKGRSNKQDLVTELIEPGLFGVYREDVCGLENQEAFFHEYYITKSQLAYQLRVAGHEGVDAIVAAAIEGTAQPQGPVTAPGSRIDVSEAQPMTQGEYNTTLGQRIQYNAVLLKPMVRMFELYVFDDEIKDLRVFTVANPFLPVYDRSIETAFIGEERPFVQVCPFPMHGYFWGISALERMMTLQSMRNRRWDQVQHIEEMEAEPAQFVTGDVSSNPDEISDAFNTPGSIVTSAIPNSSVTPVKPTPPEDLFATVNYLDSQMDDAMGTNDVMSGRGEPGVRSEGHASKLMQAGSTRAKKRALIVERQIEELATLILKILRKFSDRVYETDEGMKFTANEFTEEFMVHVDAHSSSPIFMIDIANQAFALFKAKAIDRATLIDMLNVPMKDLLKQQLKTKIEPAEAQAAAKQQALEIATGKVSKIGSGSSKK